MQYKYLIASIVFILAFVGFAEAQTITVDDFSSNCKLEGVWADNKSNGYGGGGTVGDRFHYTSRHSPFKKTGREKATWYPNLPKAGNYKVEVSFRSTENRSSRVVYEVIHADGRKRIKVNQRKGHDMTWVTLGTFRFEAGRQGAVAFVSDGGSSGAIDAARFSLGGKTHSNGQGNLDDVIYGSNSSSDDNYEIKLDKNNQGERTYQFKEDGKATIVAELLTYGPAEISVSIDNGRGTREWLGWRRSNDKDPSPLYEDGQYCPESMYQEKPGDWSPRRVKRTYVGKKGDRLILRLRGDFGPISPVLALQLVASKSSAVFDEDLGKMPQALCLMQVVPE